VLAEVAKRCRLHAVESVAEIDLVEIQLENLVLRELVLETRRHHDLLQLAAIRLVSRQEALTRELLRDRAAALRRASFPEVGKGGAGHADQVHTSMIVEALILHRDDCLHQIRRDPRQRHLDPLLAKDRERRAIAGIEERRCLRHRAGAVQHAAVRQVRDDLADEPCGDAGRHPEDHRERDDARSEQVSMSSERRGNLL
jgi:hypothetical protein